MISNKFLIKINNIDDIKIYKEIGITNFLFSVQDFSLNPTFSIEELKRIDANIYLNLDKLLNTNEIENFKKIISQLDFVKGIFFEDLGVYQVLKDRKIPLIWAQSHFVMNAKSVNFWLEKTHSVLISNELTKDEINYILKEASKPVVLNVFGHNIAMYSRRHLISAFNKVKEVKIPQNAQMIVNEQNKFIANETKDGTIFYYAKPFNLLAHCNDFLDDKILFYLIDDTYASLEEIMAVINGENPPSEERFFHNATIYKLED